MHIYMAFEIQALFVIDRIGMSRHRLSSERCEHLCKARKALLQIIKLGKDRQERIKNGATQLAKYAKNVLSRVPKALRKARKHKDEETQKQIEATSDGGRASTT